MYPVFYMSLYTPLLTTAIALLLAVALYQYIVLSACRPRPYLTQQPGTPHIQKNPVATSLRFRDIPNGFGEASFRSAVGSSEGGAIVGLSWTVSATTESTYTATACFSSRPSFLDHVSGKQSGFDAKIMLTCESGNVEVLADDHFHGMTPLYWHKDGPDVEYVEFHIQSSDEHLPISTQAELCLASWQ